MAEKLQNINLWKPRRWLVPVILVCTAVLNAAAPGDDQATKILQAAGVKGGLVVHVGCGDPSTTSTGSGQAGSGQAGKLTAALRANDSYLVHGLDEDAKNIDAARKHIRKLDLYGKVSVEQWPGKQLPYADNLVNLVVSEDLGAISMDEVMRVLAPKGVAYIKVGGTWKKTVKPRPKDIDDWTHYLHGPGNNAVANDRLVGPPRHLQWTGGPKWGRHHDHMSSISAMVTGGGRLLAIIDEGPLDSILLPPKWRLVARDAFNGTVLWKRDITKWFPHLFPLKSGPASLPRRLVAVGEVVYVTLGIDAPVSALDAATGKTIRQYAGSAGAEEIIVSDGMVFVLVSKTPAPAPTEDEVRANGASFDRRTTGFANMARMWARVKSKHWFGAERTVKAYQGGTGKLLWAKPSRVMPLSLAADGERVYFHNGRNVVALARTSGEVAWETEPVPTLKELQSWFAPILVVHKNVLLYAGGEKMGLSYVGWRPAKGGEDTMTAFDAKTGKKLWTADHPFGGYQSPEDLFVARGMVWAGATAKGNASGTFKGHDLATGKVKKLLPPTVKAYWFHHRCHRAKATVNYLMTSRTGIEYIDLETGKWTINHWVRGGCLYGLMPANGMTYTPPHPCACYPQAKLFGFNALAAASTSRKVPKEIPRNGRLEKGPAYQAIRPSTGSGQAIRNREDWPTYRHDAIRSGCATTHVPAKLKTTWETELGGHLSSPVIADGKVFLAQVDAHTVLALDAATGKRRWTYTAGGRVDSPPTIHAGGVLFGSADGYVYCLRAADGKMAWRFRGAPVDRRLVSYGQVESVWPVPGSILVVDGPSTPSTSSGQAGSGQSVACFAAGRSYFLDGGVRLCRLDANTGELLSETILDESGIQARIRGLDMPVALPDILSSDGERLFMRAQVFTKEGKRVDGGVPHIFGSAGFTDNTNWHRQYWIYGPWFGGGCGGYTRAGKVSPAGKILVMDDTTVYGFGRKVQYFRWTTPLEYQLFAASRAGGKQPAKKRRGGGGVKFAWTKVISVHVRAMVLADKTLFVAGPASVYNEREVLADIGTDAGDAKVAEQADAMAGRKGGLLWAVSAADGKKLAEYKLDSPPIFDGLIAADGRLYMATRGGKVICFGKQ